MPRVFTQEIPVTPDVIDELGHVNNIVYVRWMQDVAIAHSTARGWSVERYFRTGGVWVVGSHAITYRRPARVGDTVVLSTWVADLRQQSSRRCHAFRRAGSGELLADAETMWVYVDRQTGRPRRIPEDLRTAFEIVPPDESAALRDRARPAASS